MIRRCASFFVVSIFVAMAAAASAERIEAKVFVDGRERSFIAYLPDNADPAPPRGWPVLIAFHPGLGTGKYMERVTQFHNSAKGKGFVVVYPDGFQRTWNAGECCGAARRSGIDDLAFFTAILDDIGQRVPIQAEAFLTGFSNGAILSYHLACKLPDRVAAIAPVGAAYANTDCAPGDVPVLHLHGQADETAPIAGGSTNVKMFDTARQQAPARQTVEFFAGRNGCSVAAPGTRYFPRLQTDCLWYSGCSGAQTGICAIPDLGHYWPGAPAARHALARRFGPARTDLDATGVILDFFQRQGETQ
ncbi:MAG: alpha/beta hydrolase family esterase [Marinibacterium sp.]